MANIAAGTIAALDFQTLNIGNWNNLTFPVYNAEYVWGDYRSLGDPNYFVEFFGYGFTFDSQGAPTGGTVTRFHESRAGTFGYNVEQVAVPATRLWSWVYAGETQAALTDLLAGSDSIGGTPFGDHLHGYAGNDYLRGHGGDDELFGGSGDDTLSGGAGSDFLDGGDGTDTVVVPWGPSRAVDWGLPPPYSVVTWNGMLGVVPRTPPAFYNHDADNHLADIAVNVEGVLFDPRDGAVSARGNYTSFLSAAGAPVLATFAYAASHADLMSAFGSDGGAIFRHYVTRGSYEGRPITFSGSEYLASNADVLGAFGIDPEAAAFHYIALGRFEGRPNDFDGLEYIASYDDLMNAFGADQEAGARHFLSSGRAEGRAATFDGLEYIASYIDLMDAFGTDVDAGSAHYIQHGRSEGRGTAFDGLGYIASHSDLIGALGANSDAGAIHYLRFGRSEQRVDDFDPSAYLAKYPDLGAVFGANMEAATRHFIQYGSAEGRSDDPLL